MRMQRIMKDEINVIVGLAFTCGASTSDPTIHEKVKVSTSRKKQIDIYVVDSGSEAGMTVIVLRLFSY